MVPTGLMGAMPQRSCRDSALDLELQLEEALGSNIPLMGFAVGLHRFFNLLPRAPIFFMLHHLRVPEAIMQVWDHFLQKADRHPSIQQHLGVAIPSTNGVPEGDPLSILAQGAVCWHWHSFVEAPQLRVMSFVDTWCFTADSQAAFIFALQAVVTQIGIDCASALGSSSES